MNDTPLHIALHIGAHKTATTHLQRSIQQVRGQLVAKGSQFYGPRRLRGAGKSLMDRFGLDLRRDAPPVDHQAALQELVVKADRLVLSEENFAGPLQNRWGNIPMPLYPYAPRRVSMLAEKIAPHGLHLHLGIRDPARFLTSAYGQALLSGKQVTMQYYKDKNPLSQVNWADLVDRLVGAPGVASLTVWRHEDYAAVFEQICAGFFGERAGNLVPPMDQQVHRGLSAAAVKELIVRPSEGLRVAAVQIRKDLPVGADYPAFDGFDADEHAASQVFYAQQTDQIAQMPGVTLLRP